MLLTGSEVMAVLFAKTRIKAKEGELLETTSALLTSCLISNRSRQTLLFSSSSLLRMRLFQLTIVAGVAQALPQRDLNSAGSIDPKTGKPFTSKGFQATIDFKQSTANDLTGGQCREIYLIIARGSMEGGNIVRDFH